MGGKYLKRDCVQPNSKDMLLSNISQNINKGMSMCQTISLYGLMLVVFYILPLSESAILVS